MDTTRHEVVYLSAGEVTVRHFRPLLVVGGMFAVIWAGCWISTRLGFVGPKCHSEVLQEAVSPDGRYVATAFEHDCGATARYVRIISVRWSQASFDAENENRWAFIMEGQPEVRLSWTKSTDLTVKHLGGVRLMRKAVVWDGIPISYE